MNPPQAVERKYSMDCFRCELSDIVPALSVGITT